MDRAVDAGRLRDAIVTGAAVDFRNSAATAPPRFGLCLRLGMRRALDTPELRRLALTFRRPSGRQLTAQALNALAAPLGDRCGGRRYVPEMVGASKAMGAGHLVERLTAPRGPGLRVSYGPYLGIAGCPRPNLTRCHSIGFDIVLGRRATAVSALIAGRPIRLISPGPVPHNANAAGRDWGGYLHHVGLEDKGSPFYIPLNGRSPGTWAGQPPVYVPVRVVVTRPSGNRVQVTFPRVFLSPGFG